MVNTLLALSMLVSVCQAGYEAVAPSALRPDTAARQWADSVYNTLTERERVAQLVIPRLDLTDNAAGRAQMTKMVKEGIGGFLLGKGTISDYAGLIALAQDEAKVPLMVTLDGEWGLAMRITDAPRFPYNMTLGAITDPRVLHDYGAEVGRECKALGINVDFAPVLDVNSNPANPVIGYRSFGEDPHRVAELGVAYSRGMESRGVMSVAKHFPGHGDTATDSHKTLPTVDHSRAVLDSVDLYPFKRYIDSGLSGVMVGHLNVPALDRTGTPSSLSLPIVTDLLKGELGFKGMVFTDALAMKGAGSAENNCVAALRAGVDVLLQPESPQRDIDAVLKAVADGKIAPSVIEERCKKMLAYKYMLGLANRTQPRTPEQIKAEICSQQAEDVNRRLCAAAITCVKDADHLLPVRHLKERTIAVVSLGAKADNVFTEYCRKYADVKAFGAPDGALTSTQLQQIKACDVVIVAVLTDSKGARSGFAQLDDVKNLVPVFFLNPYKMAPFASSIARHGCLVAAYEDTPLMREYAAQAVFGGIPMTGRFPVNVKGVATVGQGVDVNKSRLAFTTPGAAGLDPALSGRIDRLVADAMKSGAFPGCQVLVAKGGDVIIDKAYGETTKGEGSAPVTTATLYDIASMTKATATTAGIMRAIDEGLISLDDPVSRYLEVTDSTAVGRITIRQLLTHESGLPATINMFTMMTDTATYTSPLTSKTKADPYTIKIEDGLYGNNKAQLDRRYVRTEPSDSFDMEIARGLYVGQHTLDAIMQRIYRINPGSRSYRYSDLNFCLLMAVEEAATEEAHDQWVDLEIFEPLGAYNTMYRPVADGHVPLSRIAATETDNFLRRQSLQGYVHDEIAAFSGGIQGNAGLFSTAEDVAKYCQMLLYGGVYGGEQILSSEVVKEFTTARAGGGRRALGFDRKCNSSSAPASTFGHTGFTGTCFWVDPDNDLIFVFLSNRVCPSRSNGAWSRASIRGAILDEVYRAL